MKKTLSMILVIAMLLSCMSGAFAAAPAAGTANTLTEDVVLTETLVIDQDTTIDLAGNDITSADVSDEEAQIKTLIYVKDGATLTITDSVGGGVVKGGTRTNTKDYSGNHYTIHVEASKLIVDSAIIEGSTGINTKYGATAINANEGSTVIITGSTVKGGDVEKNGITSENYESYYSKYQGDAGDAVYAHASTVLITNSTILGGNGLADDATQISYISGGANHAEGGVGIALSQTTASAVVTGSTVKGGDSTLYNAEDAISLTFGAALTVSGSTVTGGSCLVKSGYGIAGAGIYTVHNAPVITVTGSTVTGGSTDDSWIGSGIEISTNTSGATVEVTNSTVATGSGDGDGSDAYAIEVENADDAESVTLTDATLKAVDADSAAIADAVGSVVAEGTLTVDGGSLGNVAVQTTGGVTVEGDDTVTPTWIVAKVNNKGYGSIEDALVAAQENDVITVSPGEYTTKITISKTGVTLQGTLDADGNYLTKLNGTISVATAAKDVTIKDLYIVTGDNAITIKDGVVDNVKVENAWKAFVLSYAGAGDNVTIKNSETVNVVYIAHNDAATETTTYNFEDNYFHSSFGLTMGKSGLVTVTGNTFVHEVGVYSDYGVVRTFAAPAVIRDNSFIDVKTSKKRAETEWTVEENYYSLGVENSQEDTGNTAVIPSYYLDEERTALYDVAKALVDAPVAEDAIITFTEAASAEKTTTYDIAITADSEGFITNVVSAQMNIDLDETAVLANGMKVGIQVVGANDFQVSRDAMTGKYLFNLPEGSNETVGKKSGERVVIGQVILTGYTYRIGESEVLADVNVTNAFYNYKDFNDSLAKVQMLIDDSTMQHSKAVPAETLTVNVAFPNAVVDNAANQAMTVTISGGDLAADIVYDLSGKMANGGYTVTADLTQNVAYNVTVSGDGYRTAYYTVTMTDAKTLNFWNNVKDEATVVEIGEASSAVTVTYLAGDIVSDNEINIYDLSAVVSYFATNVDYSAYNAYIQYDLNRDGVIDSKDVAYVLASWGK